MKSVSVGWVFGAVSALALGMQAEACSSSSSSVGTSSSTSSAHSSGASTSASSGASSTAHSGASTVATSGASKASGSSSNECYSAPASKVYVGDGGSFYCPFGKTDAGDVYCTAGTQHCCEPSSGTATCEPTATACASDSDWHCEGTADCAGTPGTICCGTGTPTPQAAQPGCAADGGTVAPYTYIDDFKTATCVPPAMCTTYELCYKPSDCGGGAPCVPTTAKGNDIGFCSGGPSAIGTGIGSGGGSSTAGTSSTSSGSASGSGSSTAG